MGEMVPTEQVLVILCMTDEELYALKGGGCSHRKGTRIIRSRILLLAKEK